MITDKRNKHIGYNDEYHKYWNVKTKSPYTSVTTFIGKFKPPFDGEYWSTYKVLEAMLDKEFIGLRNSLGKQDGLWVICAYYKKLIQGRVREFNKRKKELLLAWQRNTTKACIKGTKAHQAKEDYWLSKAKRSKNGKTFYKGTTHILSEHECGFFPELLVYNDEHMLAGQIDLCIKEENNITIVDYKTNKELKFHNKWESMHDPVAHLDNCNFIHYSLQLSLYGYILEQQGYNVKALSINYIPDKHTDKNYKVKYLKEDIVNMLNYGKQKKL